MPDRVSLSSTYNRSWSLAKLRQLEFSGHCSYLEAIFGSVNAPLLSHFVVDFEDTGVPTIQRLTDHMLQLSTTAAYVGVDSSSVIIRGCPVEPSTGRDMMLFQAKLEGSLYTPVSFEILPPVMEPMFSRIGTLILSVGGPRNAYEAATECHVRLWSALFTKAAFGAATRVRADGHVMPSVLRALKSMKDFRFPPNIHEVRLDLSADIKERTGSAWIKLLGNYFHPSVDISYSLHTMESWVHRHSDCGALTAQQ
ncbi:hypothetical protein BC834DRAFT_974673 [Gloeopeniophorella convolvens]|nr:hypothetical protein BC834DRAFT_974673 [Gloeopeniophorella convolvens]